LRLSFESDLILLVPQLRRYARTLARDTAWADDLVQDAMERALGHGHSFTLGTNLRAWAFTILRNLYLDQLRRHREVAMDEDTLPWNKTAMANQAVDGLLLRDLQRALFGLPVEQREVLMLVGVEEFTYQEAATVLGIPIGTVMSRLSRAREQMRELMDKGLNRKAASLRVVRGT
jgi:RNA polymerase sigma-70 factor (ECF subfamily)